MKRSRVRGFRSLVLGLLGLGLVLVIALAGVWAESSRVAAQPVVPLDPAIPALRDRQEQLRRQRDQLQRQGQDLQNQQIDRQRQGQRLDGQVQTTTKAAVATSTDLNRLQANLRAMESEYARADQAYHGKRLAIVARLRFLQRQSPHWGFAVLMQSQSLNQFLDRRVQIERVYTADRQRLQNLSLAAQELGRKRDRLRDQQRDLIGQSLDIEQKRSQFVSQRNQVQKAAQDLQTQRDRLQELDQELASDSASVSQLLQVRLSQQRQRETLAQQAFQAQQRREAAFRLAQLREAARLRAGSNAAGVPWPVSGLPADLANLDRQGFEAQARALGLWGGELRPPVLASLGSGFGWREHPILGERRFHQGTDFAAPYGATIRAAHSGLVVSAGWLGGYGYAVVIDRGDGLATLYGHTSEMYVTVGQTVQTGDPIAAVGSTGLSTGPHLHFEVRRNGEPTDPLPYLQSFPSGQAQAQP